eukprot:scaffold3722_cov263-Pinguiococcus_pyrenoidosus.AAC.8
MELVGPEAEDRAAEERDKMSLDGFVSKTRKLSISEVQPTEVAGAKAEFPSTSAAFGYSSRVGTDLTSGHCAVCAKDTTYRCSRCGTRFYCSRIHQVRSSPPPFRHREYPKIPRLL